MKTLAKQPIRTPQELAARARIFRMLDADLESGLTGGLTADQLRPCVAGLGDLDNPKGLAHVVKRIWLEGYLWSAFLVGPEGDKASVVRLFEHGPERICRVCSCTDGDCSQCVERTGLPCAWYGSGFDVCGSCYFKFDPADFTPGRK